MNTMSDYKEQEKIGRRLKAARLTRGISQWQLCQKIGLKSAKILAKYENGTFRIPEDLVRRFAKELGVTADYILKGEQMEATVMEAPKPQIATAIVKPEVVIGEPEPKARFIKRPRIDDVKNYLWVKGDVFCKILSDVPNLLAFILRPMSMNGKRAPVECLLGLLIFCVTIPASTDPNLLILTEMSKNRWSNGISLQVIL